MRTYRVALSLDRVGVHGASRQGLSHFRPSTWISLLLINHLDVRRQNKANNDWRKGGAKRPNRSSLVHDVGIIFIKTASADITEDKKDTSSTKPQALWQAELGISPPVRSRQGCSSYHYQFKWERFSLCTLYDIQYKAGPIKDVLESS